MAARTPSRRRICSMVRVTEVVPAPDEPVIAMIGCWAVMSAVDVREPVERALPEQRGVEDRGATSCPTDDRARLGQRVGIVAGARRPARSAGAADPGSSRSGSRPPGRPGSRHHRRPGQGQVAGAVRQRPGRRLLGDGLRELVGVALRKVQAVSRDHDDQLSDLLRGWQDAGLATSRSQTRATSRPPAGRRETAHVSRLRSAPWAVAGPAGLGSLPACPHGQPQAPAG